MKTSEVISVVALAVSLCAAFFSYRLGRHTFRVNAYHGATDRTLQMDQVFITYPRLRPYFAEGVATPPAGCEDVELRERVLAVAEFVCDILEDCWDKEECYLGPDRDAWRDWIYEVFDASPACSEHYAANVAWYPTLERLFDDEGGAPQAIRDLMTAPPAPASPAPKPPTGAGAGAGAGAAT